MVWFGLAAGLVLLLAGGEGLVRGSVAVAARAGMSKLLIGLTLVGFGTSMPELVASLQAALAGSPGVAIGNVVGSNIANVLLILGLSAVILPVVTTRRAFSRDGSVLIAVSVLMVAIVLSGVLGRLAGAGLLVLLVGYTYFTYRSESLAPGPASGPYVAEAEEVAPRHMGLPTALALTAGGIAGVLLGAWLLVESAIDIARAAGMSEAVIGLTLVAIGTSLPELATSAVAAIRRHGDVAFGNVVGSNIFNILGIAGTTALAVPLEVPAQIVRFDVWVMLGAAVLMALFAVTAWRISRWEGAVLLSLYAAYLAVQLIPGLRGVLGLG